jgi:histidine triad (HIT) family protein
VKCIFCEIVKGNLPSNVIWENENCLAFTPLEMEVNGHLLVIPKAHFNDVTDIDTDSLSEVMNFVKECCNKIKGEYGYTGFNLLNASGKSAQQSVGHFHIHILPRKEEDGIEAWPKLGVGENIYATSHNKL